jgi:hypothetical protein
LRSKEIQPLARQAREGFEAKALQDDRLQGVDCRTLHSCAKRLLEADLNIRVC